jgi:Flp pilus assembly protein TadD
MARGPGISPGLVVREDVSLVDVAPTILALVAVPSPPTEGVSLVPALRGRALEPRPLYAGSLAPRLDFGWAELRAVREGGWKYIAAPRPELYDLSVDAPEATNRVSDEPSRRSRLESQLAHWPAPGDNPSPSLTGPGADAAARLRSLGYLSGGGPGAADRASRPDPKDRIAVASRMATVTSGEVAGDALMATLEAILHDDPHNPQAHLRLGFAELAAGRCPRAEPHLEAALASGVPSADAGLGLAECRSRAGDLTGAAAALSAAQTAEPGNPVVIANLGILAMEQGRLSDAVHDLRSALALEPRLLEARFALARALARSGDRVAAAAEAAELLRRLPADAPQRAEVERLLTAVR